MKTIQKKLGGHSSARRMSLVVRLKLGLAGLLAATSLAAIAQPANDNFASAVTISGQVGTTAGNNQGATLEAGETNSVGTDDNGTVGVTNSVWYQWTAPQNGNVTFDTIGSVDVNFNDMDTVLAIWTGSTVPTLIPVAADDNSGDGTATSKLTFFAVAGTTYYISVDLNANTPGLPGNYVLNWNEQGAPNSGTFQFTSPAYQYSDRESMGPDDTRGFMRDSVARATITRVGGADGMVDVGYNTTEGIYTNWGSTNIYTTEIDTTYYNTNNTPIGFTNLIVTLYDITNAYQDFNLNVGGQNGFFYKTNLMGALLVVSNNNNNITFLYSNDIPYVTNPPNICGLPPASSGPVTNGNLIYISVTNYSCTNYLITNYISSYSGTVITNLATYVPINVGVGQVAFQDFEMNQDILIPYTGSILPNLADPYVTVSMSSLALDPFEDQSLPVPTSNVSRSTAIVSFSSSLAAISTWYGTQALTNPVVDLERATLECNKTVQNSGVAYVYVTLNAPQKNAVTAYYEIDHVLADDDNNTFRLQPGSDYARPNNPADGIYTAANDFTNITGSVTFPANNNKPQLIKIPITQDNEVKFNRDIQVQLYWPDGTTPDAAIGNIDILDLTALFSTPPAGAVDTAYNPENNPMTSQPYNLNPGANGQVFAAVVQPSDGQTVIGGDFTGYNNNNGASANNYITRLNTYGQLDTSFNTGSGFDGDVQGVAIDTNGNIIAVGSFHSFNGTLRNGIARLMTNGSLDTSFNPGFGSTNTVWCVALQTNGQILIGGDFTSYNQTNANYIARLNTDGSLDTTFQPGTGPNGDVYSLAVETNGAVIIGGTFTTVDNQNIAYIAGLNADGSLNSGFNTGSGVDTPVNAVLVQTNGQVLMAGNFTQINGIPAGPGVARLNADGSLDSGFNVGTGPDDVVYSMALQPDGKILIGGLFRHVNQTRRISLARLLPNGWLDTSFMDTAYNQFAGLPNSYYDPNVNPPNPVNAIALQTDGNVIIGGSFQEVGGDGENLTSVSNTVSNVRNGMHARSNVARLVGGITPGPGNVGLALSSYSANNNSPSAYITLDRTNGTLGAVGATFEAIPQGSGAGFATYGVDYTLGNAAPVWGVSWPNVSWMLADGLSGQNNDEFAINGSTFYTGLTGIALNIISNNNANASLDVGMTQPQGMDTFFLGGTSTGSTAGFGNTALAQGENIPLGVALANTLAPLSIIHNNTTPGVFNLSQAYYYVGESSNSIVITITRTGGTSGQVSVKCSTINGTASSGVDYTGKTSILTFNNGVASQTFTVSITPGNIARPDRIFNVSLSVATGGASLGTITNAQVEIINNNITSGFATFVNGAILSANLMGFGTNENNTPAIIPVARLGGSSGVLTVNFSSTNGSAMNGTNYTIVNTNLSWANNDVSVKNVAIPVIDDNVVTSNLTVNLHLFGAQINGVTTSNLTGLYTNGLLVITNTDSYGTVEFTAASYTVDEYSGYMYIPVVRTGGSSSALNVNYTTVNGTAKGGINYGSISGTLNFAAGQTSTNLIIGITNLDSPASPALTFDVVLTSITPTNVLGTPSTAQVNIQGSQGFNVPPGQPNPTYNAFGFNGAVSSLALQSNGKLLVGGSFTEADGVSRQGIARLNVGGTLDTTFSSYLPTAGANNTVQSVVWQTNGLILVGGLFTTFNNNTLNHIARLNVNGSLDSSFVPGAGTDNPIYAMAQNYVNGVRKIVIGGAFTLYNGTSRNGIAQLTDTGGLDGSFSPSAGANATVYAVAVQPDGRVIIGGDFTTVNGVTMNHIARLNTDGSVDPNFNPGTGASDSVRALAVQLDGRILVGGLFTNFNGSVYNHVVRLNANGSTDSSFTFGSGANGNVSTIAVQTDTRIVVGGSFSQFNGVTRNGVTRLNPDGTTDYTINFGSGADGSVSAAVVESGNNIDLGGAFANFNGISHPDLVQIYGDSLAGSGAIQFNSAVYQVNENGLAAVITLVRTGGTAGPGVNGSGDVLIPFATSNITAVAGVNYTAVSTNVDFPAGEVFKSIVIPVFDDGVITSNLLVGLKLGTPTPPAQSGQQQTALLTIINDDSGISFSPAAFGVGKNAPNGLASVNVARFGGTNGTSSVYFSTTTNGTAQAGVDYTPITNALLTFNPGVTNVVVPITIINNGLSEGNLTVTMTLTNATGSQLVAPTNGILTIINTVTSPGTISFATTNYTANASDGSTPITLIRTGGTSGSVSVTCTNIPGTALLGVNYSTAVSTVTFNDGDTSETFYVPLINNPVPQPPVSLTLDLISPTGGASLGITNAQLTIVNTNVGIAFANVTNIISETAGTAELYVQRFGVTNGQVSVNYYTTNGTAIAGSNYVAAAGTLTFFPGENLKPIPVTLLNNPLQTVNLNFSAYLTVPTTPAEIISPTGTVVVITAANAGLSFATNVTTVLKNAGSVVVPVYCSNPQVEPVIVSSNTVPLEVSYYSMDGTAVAGQNYQAVSGTLVFTNGIGTNYITVPILNNGQVTGNEGFSLILTNPTAPGELTAPSTNSVVIVESNAGLEFSQSQYSVFKNGGSETINVYRVGNTNNTVSVNYLATNGTAVAGQNYYPTNGTLTFTNGVTDQQFTVPILAYSQVQPNLTVLLQLSSPSNAYLVSPSAATLTILENGGSVVIPAGAQMVTNYTSYYDYTNDIIGSNDTVQVLFAFRASAGLGVTNLMATLLTTNGVLSPSPASQVYGPLAVYGHSVSEPFTFTAHGTNALSIAPTFNLYDNGNGGKFLGTATFGFTIGTWTTTFYNSNTITINDNAAATPYPSVINVTGLGGSIVKSTVTLNGLTHTRPADVGVLVVTPSGTNTLLMANAGGGYSVTNIGVTFDDSAAASLPQNAQMTTNTNKPTAYPPVNQFP